ncbi:unnamed protein product [Leptosia nina]|uniref:DUF229 domain containing protein n=1 Tax=Leptosia nina TaxID=320188 RepID=A0AAV1JMF4_9NEOP
MYLSNYATAPHLDTLYETFVQDSYTIRTEGCSIPALHPLDAGIKEFVKYPESVKSCLNSKSPFLENNTTHIWIKKENVMHYNVSDDSFLCCYRSFYRPSSVKDIHSAKIDDRVEYRKCKHFKAIIEANDEFVHVVCYTRARILYQQYYLFVVNKELSWDSAVNARKNKTSYNVIILGIDAVSRLNFYRTMPKTLNFLTRKGAIELKGYNKVGDNTFPNLIPMLLGIRESELKKTCVPNPKYTFFDNCPFIWDWYKEAGYYTALGEDSASLGTFNYLRGGFARNPTDYYLRTFIREAEKNVGNNKDFNSLLCMNNKYFYRVLLDYIENLLIKMRSSRLFGFFWEVTMSHDYLNYPMLMDFFYEQFFKNLDHQKVLEDTIIFLVSDHGIRWGNIRATKQGRLEERLPFVHILVPDSFKKKYNEAYSNLKLNRQRLTTPFNLYTTLNDLIDLSNIENSNIKSRSQKSYWRERAISLFLPLPGNRTCSIADIDDHWCTCHRERKISTESVEALLAANYILKEINNLVHNYKLCSVLNITEIVDATELEAGTEEDSEVSWREYMVVLRTSPGGAVFESTVRDYGTRWSLIGTISRLNLYGYQSHCIDNYNLKLYCYCL